jgi:hypothetical protein
LPRKDYIKKDGTKGWNDILKFTDFDVFKKFQAEVLEALDEYMKKTPEETADSDVPF